MLAKYQPALKAHRLIKPRPRHRHPIMAALVAPHDPFQVAAFAWQIAMLCSDKPFAKEAPPPLRRDQ